MSKLNRNFLALRVGELGNALEAERSLKLVVVPDSCILRGDTSFWDDGSSFDYGQTRAPGNDAAEMGELPATEVSFVRRVLAKRRKEDAVLKGETADCERLEDLGDGFAVWLGIRGCSGWRLLSWCKV